jgi:hypothetical protein
MRSGWGDRRRPGTALEKKDIGRACSVPRMAAPTIEAVDWALKGLHGRRVLD